MSTHRFLDSFRSHAQSATSPAFRVVLQQSMSLHAATLAFSMEDHAAISHVSQQLLGSIAPRFLAAVILTALGNEADPRRAPHDSIRHGHDSPVPSALPPNIRLNTPRMSTVLYLQILLVEPADSLDDLYSAPLGSFYRRPPSSAMRVTLLYCTVLHCTPCPPPSRTKRMLPHILD